MGLSARMLEKRSATFPFSCLYSQNMGLDFGSCSVCKCRKYSFVGWPWWAWWICYCQFFFRCVCFDEAFTNNNVGLIFIIEISASLCSFFCVVCVAVADAYYIEIFINVFQQNLRLSKTNNVLSVPPQRIACVTLLFDDIKIGPIKFNSFCFDFFHVFLWCIMREEKEIVKERE